MSTGMRWAASGLLVGFCAVVPGAVRAAELDGSTPILCAMIAATECDRWGVCDTVDPAAAGLPPFVRVNVAQKSLEATDGSGRKSEIQSATVAKEQKRLLLQGSEQGRLWSAVIGQQGGELTVSILDHDGGFVVSGTCTLP
jgi:hypothetical protein